MTDNSQLRGLLPHQCGAIEHVRGLALPAQPGLRANIVGILERAGLDESAYDKAINNLRTHARVGLHFHPERLSRSGLSVCEGFLREGLYRNQFETGLSSGSPSGFAGGERDLWEKRLFGNAYHSVEVQAAERPKYGALEIMYHPDGPAPRFGSCFFILRPEVSRRSTFTFGGSHEDQAPERTGTLDTLDSVMAPLLSQLDLGQGAFAVNDLTVSGLLAQLTDGLSKPFGDPQDRPLGRALDSFIEAQVHGAIRLDKDVERMVADPAFKDHAVGQTLAAISAKCDISLCWHPGLTLPVTKVPNVFRDYPIRPLAERIAGQGVLDAANIGKEANSLHLTPETWEGYASHEEILAQFRRLWHAVVLFGTPRSNDTGRFR